MQVAHREGKLQGRIDAYQRKAAEFWAPDSTDSCPCPDRLEEVDFDSSDSEDEADNNANVFLTSHSMTRIRQSQFHCSYLRIWSCRLPGEGYPKYVQQERTLRVGQANDALQGLRLAIERKAVIFCEQIHPGTNQNPEKLRYGSIRMVDVNGRHHATVYCGAGGMIHSCH